MSLKVIRECSITGKVLGVQNIHEATDLYDKFRKSHSVNRIHCEYDELTEDQRKKVLAIIQS